jgi:predicted RecB family nuclease
MEDPSTIAAIAKELDVETDYQNQLDATTDRLFHIAEPTPPSGEKQGTTVSVTGLVTYSQCPKRFFWTEVDPLPRRRNLAALRGTEIHRRIELHQRGQVPFEEMSEDLYDFAPDDRGATGPGGYAAYESSRFAAERAALVETPFSIELETAHTVRGRIDAIYRDGTHWEVVDFKSGEKKQDPSRIVQLQAYALAVSDVDFGLAKPEQLDMTFAFLGGGLHEETHHADQAWVDRARSSVNQIGRGIADEEFDPNPGAWCRHCDFLEFCKPGRAFLGK